MSDDVFGGTITKKFDWEGVTYRVHASYKPFRRFTQPDTVRVDRIYVQDTHEEVIGPDPKLVTAAVWAVRDSLDYPEG